MYWICRSNDHCVRPDTLKLRHLYKAGPGAQHVSFIWSLVTTSRDGIFPGFRGLKLSYSGGCLNARWTVLQMLVSFLIPNLLQGLNVVLLSHSKLLMLTGISLPPAWKKKKKRAEVTVGTWNCCLFACFLQTQKTKRPFLHVYDIVQDLVDAAAVSLLLCGSEVNMIQKMLCTYNWLYRSLPVSQLPFSN